MVTKQQQREADELVDQGLEQAAVALVDSLMTGLTAYDIGQVAERCLERFNTFYWKEVAMAAARASVDRRRERRVLRKARLADEERGHTEEETPPEEIATGEQVPF
jgi:hypothetical protein